MVILSGYQPSQPSSVCVFLLWSKFDLILLLFMVHGDITWYHPQIYEVFSSNGELLWPHQPTTIRGGPWATPTWWETKAHSADHGAGESAFRWTTGASSKFILSGTYRIIEYVQPSYKHATTYTYIYTIIDADTYPLHFYCTRIDAHMVCPLRIWFHPWNTNCTHLFYVITYELAHVYGCIIIFCIYIYTSLYTHTHIHMNITIYIHTYVHTYILTYIHTYIHTYIYIYIYIRTYIHTYVHTYIRT